MFFFITLNYRENSRNPKVFTLHRLRIETSYVIVVNIYIICICLYYIHIFFSR